MSYVLPFLSPIGQGLPLLSSHASRGESDGAGAAVSRFSRTYSTRRAPLRKGDEKMKMSCLSGNWGFLLSSLATGAYSTVPVLYQVPAYKNRYLVPLCTGNCCSRAGKGESRGVAASPRHERGASKCARHELDDSHSGCWALGQVWGAPIFRVQWIDCAESLSEKTKTNGEDPIPYGMVPLILSS